jgi:hypothetical protein
MYLVQCKIYPIAKLGIFHLVIKFDEFETAINKYYTARDNGTGLDQISDEENAQLNCYKGILGAFKIFGNYISPNTSKFPSIDYSVSGKNYQALIDQLNALLHGNVKLVVKVIT